jgi:hypothetical protein
MISLVAGVLLQIGAYGAMPGVDSVPRDALTDSLRIAETKFFLGWRREWVGNRRGTVKATYLRLASLHCHYDGSWKSGAPNLIRSKGSTRSYCPVWFPAEDSVPSDETLDGVDASLNSASRDLMRRQRGELIERFQKAAQANPANPWIAGQLVRLAVDQRDFGLARRAAESCRAAREWCLLLSGFAEHAAGRAPHADSIFQRAVGAMRERDRCEWTSVAALLESRARGAYERLDCASRDSVDATFWWLADPLYLEPGNARRADHFARQVLVRLHAAVGIDGRFDWSQRSGGDALATMIIRYGWPSYLFWAGYYEDNGHFEWLGFHDNAVNVATEYALPRYHSAPPWNAVLDPSALTSADGSRFGPRMGYGAVDWENDFWPTESALRTAGPVLDVSEQMIVLRRDNDALLAIGMDVPQKFFAPGQRIPYDAAVILARDPTDRWVPARESLMLDGKGTTVLVSPLAPRAQIVSAELAPADGAPGLAVRVRRAVHPPAPLSALKDGEVALSDPIFYRPGDAAEPPNNAAEAVPKMFGSLAFNEKRVGLCWETYGLAPGDTVDVAIRVANIDKPGLLKRLGATIGIGDAEVAELTVHWREPRVHQKDAVIWAGDIPIQSRGVVLDVSRLRPGRYTVEVSITKLGGSAVSTRRDIRVSRELRAPGSEPF